MRKSNKWVRVLSCTTLALAMCVLGCGVDTLTVSAGSSSIVVDNTSFADELVDTKWNDPNGDIVIKSGKIIFPSESTSDTRLITRNTAKATEYYDEMFHANYTMKFKSIPKGEKFIVGFALRTVESYCEEVGNVEVVFENRNGIHVSLRAFDEDGAERILTDATKCGISEGTTFNISVKATNKNKLTVTVNNKTLYNSKTPVDLEGRMGFLQTGSCTAEIYKVDILSHIYETPENTNIVEKFENEGVDQSILTSTMTRPTGYLPSGIMIEEYNGSGVLMFHNVIDGSFGTIHQYSNFEVSFDVPYSLYKNKMDEKGNISSEESAGFVIGIGDDTDTHSSYGYQNSADGIVCEPRSIYNHGQDVRVDLTDKGYYDEENNVGYSVKVKVGDAQETGYVKALKTTKWDQVFTYSLGDSTPLGYIHVWPTGRANFGMDNFKVVNLDKGANVIELEEKYATIPEAKDWEYEPMEVVYAKTTEGKNAGEFNWKMLLVYAGIAAVVIVGSCTVVARVKSNPKKKEAENHEN